MKKIILLAFLPLFFLSCDDETYSTIPYRPVNLKLDLRFEDMKDLNPKLGFKTFTKDRMGSNNLGFGGVLVVNGCGTNPVDLYAYDLACPVEAPDVLVRIIPDNEGCATCPECGAKYDIASGIGHPISGGGGRCLRSYKVIDTRNNTYLVRN
ncbi:hypothetical protein LJC52_03040 [Bacteroidales bacterium OttesenSCG-928-A17]|nr:hypothetical protein [Bacteroidales bacterium OttesenSCG-928-A17]